ncbi:MAG: hypothetical protein J3K34DRAFT_419658 [Monoraphidium minutum]|nr:MAG: hypothetical protein J3K34DRAFT_419658 [Monoraphidium minutum]
MRVFNRAMQCCCVNMVTRGAAAARGAPRLALSQPAAPDPQPPQYWPVCSFAGASANASPAGKARLAKRWCCSAMPGARRGRPLRRAKWCALAAAPIFHSRHVRFFRATCWCLGGGVMGGSAAESRPPPGSYPGRGDGHTTGVTRGYRRGQGGGLREGVTGPGGGGGCDTHGGLGPAQLLRLGLRGTADQGAAGGGAPLATRPPRARRNEKLVKSGRARGGGAAGARRAEGGEGPPGGRSGGTSERGQQHKRSSARRPA